jgi:hypothetical protein
MFTIDMVYYLYMQVVRVDVGIRHGKGRHKVQMFTAEQVEELRSFLAQKHNRAVHSGEKLVGGRGSSRVGEGSFESSCKSLTGWTVRDESKMRVQSI